ncbi:UNVERIFIED_CONTAM: hypothetical protein Slati_3538300 [Sesamum latifolium]|uniref:Uncharacterized protein n=1 Tax=Sesamum latifolium TaxID=2727402 RepID=A0AAW2UJ60_9LAMI
MSYGPWLRAPIPSRGRPTTRGNVATPLLSNQQPTPIRTGSMIFGNFSVQQQQRAPATSVGLDCDEAGSHSHIDRAEQDSDEGGLQRNPVQPNTGKKLLGEDEGLGMDFEQTDAIQRAPPQNAGMISGGMETVTGLSSSEEGVVVGAMEASKEGNQERELTLAPSLNLINVLLEFTSQYLAPGRMLARRGRPPDRTSRGG